MSHKNPLRIFNASQIERLKSGEHNSLKKEILLQFQFYDTTTISLNGHEVDRNEVINIFDVLEGGLEEHLGVLDDLVLSRFFDTEKLVDLVEWNSEKLSSLQDNTKTQLANTIRKRLYEEIFSDSSQDDFEKIVTIIENFNPQLQDSIYSHCHNLISSELEEHNQEFKEPFTAAKYRKQTPHCYPIVEKYIKLNVFNKLHSMPIYFSGIIEKYKIFCERIEEYREHYYKNIISIPDQEYLIIYNAAIILNKLVPSTKNEESAKLAKLILKDRDAPKWKTFLIMFFLLAMGYVLSQFIIWACVTVEKRNNFVEPTVSHKEVYPEPSTKYNFLGGQIQYINPIIDSIVHQANQDTLYISSDLIPIDFNVYKQLIPDSIKSQYKGSSKTFIFKFNIRYIPGSTICHKVFISFNSNANVDNMKKIVSPKNPTFTVHEANQGINWIGRRYIFINSLNTFELSSSFSVRRNKKETIFNYIKYYNGLTLDLNSITNPYVKHPGYWIAKMPSIVNDFIYSPNRTGTYQAALSYYEIIGNYVSSDYIKSKFSCLEISPVDNIGTFIIYNENDILTIFIDAKKANVRGLQLVTTQVSNGLTTYERVVLFRQEE